MNPALMIFLLIALIIFSPFIYTALVAIFVVLQTIFS